MEHHRNLNHIVEEEHADIRNSLLRLVFPDGRGGQILPIDKLNAFCAATDTDPLEILHGAMILSLDWPDKAALADFQREMVKWLLDNRIRSKADADILFAGWRAEISNFLHQQQLSVPVPDIPSEMVCGWSGNGGGVHCP